MDIVLNHCAGALRHQFLTCPVRKRALALETAGVRLQRRGVLRFVDLFGSRARLFRVESSSHLRPFGVSLHRALRAMVFFTLGALGLAAGGAAYVKNTPKAAENLEVGAERASNLA